MPLAAVPNGWPHRRGTASDRSLFPGAAAAVDLPGSSSCKGVDSSNLSNFPLHGGEKIAIIKRSNDLATEMAYSWVDTFHPRNRFAMSTLTHDGSATPSLRVLIIDDDDDNAASLAMLFQISGYEAEAACCGTAAERAVRCRPPDVLFIDLGLPGEDGYAVAKRLRPLFAVKPLLVALTGHAPEAYRRRSLEEGFDHHLLKPAEPSEILRLLRDHAQQVAGCGRA
jgi:CheY-like chemotaxis protein